jgi:hypothetical protein
VRGDVKVRWPPLTGAASSVKMHSVFGSLTAMVYEMADGGLNCAFRATILRG